MISTNRWNNDIWIWGGLVVLAFMAGIYFRLIGLGTWPLSVDEFYIAQSVEFILKTGVPEFPCGGYYLRGITYQYLAVPFVAMGVSSELTLRGLSVVASLAVIPAAFFITRDAAGRRIAFLVLIVLLLSTWQIEMARFGRMYAPFQAIFIWHIYHLYFLITRTEYHRWKWIIALTVIGLLTWEGGIFLAVLNFLPFFIKQFRTSWIWISISTLVLIGSIWFSQTDFRFIAAQASAMSGMEGTSRRSLSNLIPSTDHIALALSTWSGTVFVTLCLLALSYAAWKLLADRALPHMLQLGMLCGSLLVFSGHVMFAAILFGGIMVSGWLGSEEVRRRSVQTNLTVNTFLTVGWIAFLILSFEYSLPASIRRLINMPDIISAIIQPMYQVLPDIAIFLALSYVVGSILVLYHGFEREKCLGVLLCLCLISLTLVALIPTPVNETRYFFFSYPLFIITAVAALSRTALSFAPWSAPMQKWLLTLPALFLISSDFDFQHLRAIDSYEANFRVGYSDILTRHYYARYDHAGPADFLRHSATEDDTILSTITPINIYADRLDAIYLDRSDPRYRNQACEGKQREIWTGSQLLSTAIDMREFLVANNQRTWIVVGKRSRRWNQWERQLIEMPRLTLAFTSDDDAFEVYSWRPDKTNNTSGSM
ncbi:MAG: hypothetical protein WD057_03725 [Aquisalimonadaceae bacterium]